MERNAEIELPWFGYREATGKSGGHSTQMIRTGDP